MKRKLVEISSKIKSNVLPNIKKKKKIEMQTGKARLKTVLYMLSGKGIRAVTCD